MLAEPARMASVTGLVDRWWRHHEVSIPIAAVADAGWCLGWQPRAKVSMMIMRPPQHRQGRGSTRGWSAAAASGVSGCFEDMTVRGFKQDTRRDYVRHVRAFAAFIGRSPDTATAEDLRLFQLHRTQSGM